MELILKVDNADADDDDDDVSRSRLLPVLEPSDIELKDSRLLRNDGRFEMLFDSHLLSRLPIAFVLMPLLFAE
uniref:Uncharacterized protein n=1 Tax=Glossina pallidipes TaxID=7398 RepID=A0A1A9ZC78_GLOPL